jgi:hypothetical protein
MRPSAFRAMTTSRTGAYRSVSAGVPCLGYGDTFSWRRSLLLPTSNLYDVTFVNSAYPAQWPVLQHEPCSLMPAASDVCHSSRSPFFSRTKPFDVSRPIRLRPVPGLTFIHDLARQYNWSFLQYNRGNYAIVIPFIHLFRVTDAHTTYRRIQARLR